MSEKKKSYGIICFRQTPSGIQIVMVKKSTTYHFCEFVSGHYRKNNRVHLLKLFNNMTYDEKIEILSMKFQNMWYRIYKENPDKIFLPGNQNNIWASSYLSKKNKFESTFLNDGGYKLRDLISSSCLIDTPWEFPKGRKDRNKIESDVETAIREFHEETGINSTSYKILWHVNPYVETYTDFGTTYQNIYYFAQAIDTWEPKFKFYDNQQISEVSSVRWISKNDLKYLKLEDVTYKRLINSFEKIIRKYKNAISKNSRIKQSTSLVSYI